MSTMAKSEDLENLNGAAIAMEMLMNMQNMSGVFKTEDDFDGLDDSHSDGSGDFADSPSITGGKKITVTEWKGRLVPINEHTDKLCIIYDSPISDRTYKFILHRKNNQKADNYACARCKSRKKYIRILVSGEYFLEDPEALEHICYMTGKQLELEKEKLQEKAGRAMVAARTPKPQKRYRPSRTAALTVPSSNNGIVVRTHAPLSMMSTPNDGSDALLQLLQNSGALSGLNQSSLSPTESTSVSADSSGGLFGSNIMESLMKKCDDAVRSEKRNDSPAMEKASSSRASEEKQNPPELTAEPPRVKFEYKPPVQQVMPVAPSSPQQDIPEAVPTSLAELFALTTPARSDATPPPPAKKLKPEPATSDVFFMGLKRALEGIQDQHRAQAENEIMQFVYVNLYSKYKKPNL